MQQSGAFLLSRACYGCRPAVSAVRRTILSSCARLQVFSKVGDIKRIVMGLDKMHATPCGFCFVVYYTRRDTEDCIKYINGMALDERLIRVDFDWGFRDGRQYGRGKSGGQVRILPSPPYSPPLPLSRGTLDSVSAARSRFVHMQVRDEYRMDVDWGRGGFGHIRRQALAERQAALLHQHRMYGEGQEAEAGGQDNAVSVAADQSTDPERGADGEPARSRRRRSDSDEDDD